MRILEFFAARKVLQRDKNHVKSKRLFLLENCIYWGHPKNFSMEGCLKRYTKKASKQIRN